MTKRRLNPKQIANIVVTCLCVVMIVSAVLVCSLSVASMTFGASVEKVRITDGKSVYVLTADCETVKDALISAGYNPKSVILLNCKLEDSLVGIDTIKIDAMNTLVEDKTDIDTMTKFDEYVEPTPEPTPVPTPTKEENITTSPSLSGSKNEVELFYEDIYSDVDYKTTYTYDSSMYEGTSRVVSEGKKGIKTTVYEYTKVNGVITSKVVVREYISTAPVDRVVALGTISSFTNSRGDIVGFSKCIPCVGTAYTYSEKWVDALYWTDQLGGLRARWGVIAVDPNVIPLGSKVYVKNLDGTEDYGYAIAADIGGSIKGNKIDCWMDNAPLSFCWGVRNVEVYILSDQSVDIFALRGDDQWDDPHPGHNNNIHK